jgi:cell division protein FtsZ
MNAVGDSHMVFITAGKDDHHWSQIPWTKHNTGMGGGTGTGAAPVIAEACKRYGTTHSLALYWCLYSRGILTVAIAVTPFEMEGQKRMETALKGEFEVKNTQLNCFDTWRYPGIEVLQNTVDTMVIIPNQKLLKTLDKTIPYQKSLEIVNDVLYRGVQVRKW